MGTRESVRVAPYPLPPKKSWIALTFRSGALYSLLMASNTGFVLGIVGHAADKFRTNTYRKALFCIGSLIGIYRPTLVVSGECHLGGIDKWARLGAEDLGVPFRGYPPETHEWASYKSRNLQISEASDLVVSIVVKELPPGYDGMRFDSCYHCNTKTHVKSGGCWTVKQAIKAGKRGLVIEI